MARRLYFLFSFIMLLTLGLLLWFKHPIPGITYAGLIIVLIGFNDICSKHNIRRNYPVIGLFRYIFEFVRPEIQQYFVATNLSGRPYSREQRSLVYQRAKGVQDTHPFGTEHLITEENYHFAHHSFNVAEISHDEARIHVGNAACKQPYHASRLNISAMSFGSLGENAIMSLNLGAKKGNFAHNTGEGGLSPYHLKYGGDIIWQIGTGYFGCRTLSGEFDLDVFTQMALLDSVKMIEIKLSQGAKPSHSGLLPAAKITPEIAKMRGIQQGVDCLSPPTHSAFTNPLEMMHFIQQLRESTQGKPIGFKLCIGKRNEFMAICKAMLETGIYPDFITVDGAEGGTGAAPLEFTNRLGMPGDEGLAFTHNCLVGLNLRQHIRLISSAKIVSGFDMVCKIALGADLCSMARPMLFALGCIQALRCNTDTCPTGITTQDPSRQKAIVIKDKQRRVHQFHASTMDSFLTLASAMGAGSLDDLSPDMIFCRTLKGLSTNYAEIFNYIKPGELLQDNIPAAYRAAWDNSSADKF